MKKLFWVVVAVLIAWWGFSTYGETEETIPEKESQVEVESGEEKKMEKEGDAMIEDDTHSTSTDEAMDSEKSALDMNDSAEVGDFTLQAEAVGDQKVSFTWEIPESFEEGAEGFRFARGEEVDPTYPSSWWWERGPAHRELIWEGLPEGEAYFRVCIVRNDECVEYSNNVMVTAK